MFFCWGASLDLHTTAHRALLGVSNTFTAATSAPISLGLCFDRAKLAARLLVKPLPPPPEGVAEGSKEAEAAAQAASAAATREALTKIKVRHGSMHMATYLAA
jgi:hypothetical protein